MVAYFCLKLCLARVAIGIDRDWSKAMALILASWLSKGTGHVSFPTSSSATPSVELILVIVGRDAAPGSSGVNSRTAVVSFASIDERENTAVTSWGACSTRTYLKNNERNSITEMETAFIISFFNCGDKAKSPKELVPEKLSVISTKVWRRSLARNI